MALTSLAAGAHDSSSMIVCIDGIDVHPYSRVLALYLLHHTVKRAIKVDNGGGLLITPHPGKPFMDGSSFLGHWCKGLSEKTNDVWFLKVRASVNGANPIMVNARQPDPADFFPAASTIEPTSQDHDCATSASAVHDLQSHQSIRKSHISHPMVASCSELIEPPE
eukprot:jgi/Psemu1/38470/gm1.38470_g